MNEGSMEQFKRCRTCKEKKSSDDFSYQNVVLKKTKPHCKKCFSEYLKIYRKNNFVEISRKAKNKYKKIRDKKILYAKNHRKNNPEKTRAIYWKYNHGITPDEFYIKLKEQNNRCAMCNIDMNGYRRFFAVDHNHVTNKIRGLLCDTCNHGLGFYEKYKDKYAKYLSKYNGSSLK